MAFPQEIKIIRQLTLKFWKKEKVGAGMMLTRVGLWVDHSYVGVTMKKSGSTSKANKRKCANAVRPALHVPGWIMGMSSLSESL